MRAKQPSTLSACAGSWMERVLSAGLTSKQSMRLGSLSPPAGPPFRLALAELFRSSSTRISLELTTEGGGERGREGGGGEMGMVGVGFEGVAGGGWGGLGLGERGRRVAAGGVGGSGRSRRSGIVGLRSFCCWHPFLISLRLGELSRLQGGRETRERWSDTYKSYSSNVLMWMWTITKRENEDRVRARRDGYHSDGSFVGCSFGKIS